MDDIASDRGSRVRRLRLWLIIPPLLLAAYAAAGFWLVPKLIRSQATEWVHSELHKELSLGTVAFNPFTFTLDITRAAITDQGKPMIAAGRLRLDFSALSLFGGTYRLDRLRIERPYVNALIRPDGRLNLTELFPRGKKDEPSPAVRIGTLTIIGGKVDFADLSLPLRPVKQLAPINFTLRDFQTNVADGGHFALHARSERGERFAWTGDLSLVPIRSSGRLSVDGLKADTIQRFLSERLPMVLNGGTIGFDAAYRFSYAQGTTRLDLSAPRISAAGLRLTGDPALFHGNATAEGVRTSLTTLNLVVDPAGNMTFGSALGDSRIDQLTVSPPSGAARETIKVAAFGLDRARLDYGHRILELGKLTIGGARLPIRREANGRISLAALLPASPAGAASPATPWTVRMDGLDLADAALDIEDRAVLPAAHFAIRPLRLSLRSTGGDPAKPMDLSFAAKINGRTSLSGEGNVTAATRSADLSFDLAGLPLRLVLPYLPQYPQLDLRSGTAGARGRLRFADADPATLRFQGDASIDDVSVQEASIDAPLVAWRSLRLAGIDYRAGRLGIDHGRLNGPVGRVEIMADGRFNYAPLTSGGAAPAAAATGPAADQSPAFAVRLRQLDIANGSMGFADHSINPNFEARIDALEGRLDNVSNLPDTVSTVALSGQVIDRFSPATISGSMNFFHYDRQTDMRVAFRNIELPVFNPYSGRYAGYAIAKGKLSTELEYKIDHRALQANHHVVIDQLQWGQATDSKQKVPMPIRLASSLLKDSHGVIDLELPVTGTLDDPHFRIGPLIWKIIGNIIEKAITAPFRLIGSIFAGAEKAQYVDFTPGSAALPAGSGDALGALGKALAARTELQLDIPAGPAGREDAEAIADSRIDTLLMAKEARKGRPADVGTLKLDERYDRLKQLYREKLGSKPDLEQAEAAGPADADAAKGMKESDRRKLAATEWMRAQLRAAMLPGSAELAKLGNARAVAVRDALLAGGTIDPARLFMATQLVAKPASGHSRLELKLK